MAHVTIPDEDGFVVATASAAQTDFSFTFSVFEKANLIVSQNGTDLASSAWTVVFDTSASGGYTGGTVTLNDAASDGDEITIRRKIIAARTSDFAAGPIRYDALNTEFDVLIAQVRDLQNGQARSLRARVGDSVLPFPDLADRQASGEGSILTFDGTTGDPGVRSYSDIASDAAALVTGPALAQIAAAGDDELSQIAAAGDSELVDIATAGDTQDARVGAKGDAEIADVAAAGATQVAAVQAAGSTAEAGVAAAAAAEYFADTSAGLAGTSDGDYFYVVDTSGDEPIFNLYTNDSDTTANLEGALPSKETTDRHQNEIDQVATRELAISMVLGLVTATMNRETGEVVQGQTSYGALVQSVTERLEFADVQAVPQIAISMVMGLQLAEIGQDGYTDAFKTTYGYSEGLGGDSSSDASAPAAGQYENYIAGGQVTGAPVSQVRRLDMIEGGVTPGDTAHIWRPMTAGPYAATFLQEQEEGQITVARNGEVHSVTTRVTASRLDLTEDVLLILALGQSESLGHKDGGPVAQVINADPVYALIDGVAGAGMFDSSAVDGLRRGPRVLQVSPVASNRNTVVDPDQLSKVVSLHEWTHAGNGRHFATASSSLAFTLLSAHAAYGAITLSAHIGTGSTAISEFEQGSVTSKHYENAVAVMQAAKDYATAIERGLRVAIIWEGQGTEDNESGTTIAAYKTALSGLRTDFAASLVTIDASADFYFLVNQSANMTSGELGNAGKAQAELAIEGTVNLIPSWPALPGASGTAHMTPATYMPRGSAWGHALAEVIDDANYKAPYCAFASQDGATIHYTIAGGSGAGYAFDTDTIANALDGAYGHTASDGSGALTVSSMTISGTDLAVTYTTTPSGTLIWKFGIETNDGSVKLLPDEDAARVNIRDGSARTCPMTGQIVSGWMMQHEGSEAL